jgi:hypothetical protein
MTEATTSTDFLEDLTAKKIPSTLNILTILTYIGCGTALISSLASPFLMNYSKQIMDKALVQEGLSDKQIAYLEKSQAALEITQHYIVPIVAISIIGIALCFVGALMMRKLKKDGYWLYIAGELLPILTTIILLGQYAYIDWKSLLSYAVPFLFIILYSTQRKYLVH